MYNSNVSRQGPGSRYRGRMDQQHPAGDLVTRMPDLTDTPLGDIGEDQRNAATERGTEKTGAKLPAAFFQSAV